MGGLNTIFLRDVLCPSGRASRIASLQGTGDVIKGMVLIALSSSNREFSEVNVDTTQMVHEWRTRHLRHLYKKHSDYFPTCL